MSHTSEQRARPARGFIRLPTLLLLVALAAGGYFGWAYGEMYVTYYDLRQLAKEYANRLVSGGAPLEPFLERIRLKTGLELTRSDVVVTEEDGTVWVELRVVLPVEFPFTDKVRWEDKVIEAEATRRGSY